MTSNVIVRSDSDQYAVCKERPNGPGYICGICRNGYVVDIIDAKCTRCGALVVNRKKEKIRSPEELGLVE